MGDKNRRDQVVELIKLGAFTKQEIADKIGVKNSSVSSQMTYLRWMGNFIVWDEAKRLRFTDEDGFKNWSAEKDLTKKTKTTAKRDPAVSAKTLTKTINKQTTDLSVWRDKLELLNAEATPDAELVAEAEANITLFTLKIKRNTAKLAELPPPKDVDIEDEDIADEDVVDDEELEEVEGEDDELV